MTARKSVFPLPTNKDKLEASYAFFQRMEACGSPFTLDDVCRVAGYKYGTAEMYLDKKWDWFLHPQPDGSFLCKGLDRFSKRFFLNMHGQRWESYLNRLLETNGLLLLLFLLALLLTWRRVGRRLGVRLWRVTLPLLF